MWQWLDNGGGVFIKLGFEWGRGNIVSPLVIFFKKNVVDILLKNRSAYNMDQN